MKTRNERKQEEKIGRMGKVARAYSPNTGEGSYSRIRCGGGYRVSKRVNSSVYEGKNGKDGR